MDIRRLQPRLVSRVRAIFTREDATFRRREGPLRRALSRSVPVVDEPPPALYHARMTEPEMPETSADNVDINEWYRQFSAAIEKADLELQSAVHRQHDSNTTNILILLAIYDRLGSLMKLVAKGYTRGYS